MYLLAIIIFLLVLFDLFYLYYFGNYFTSLIENIQNSKLKIRYFAMIITYILMAIAIRYIIFDKHYLKYLDYKNIFYKGALLGFVIYGIYDFTNLTTFDKWTLNASLFDTMWGSLLFGITSLITLFIINNKEKIPFLHL